MYCRNCKKYSGQYQYCKECYDKRGTINFEEFMDIVEQEEDDLICPICGQPTYSKFGNPRKDRLCAKHGIMFNNNEIKQCEKCGKWLFNEEVCICEKEVSTKTLSESTIIIDHLTRCITCGYETEGKLFCKKCYAKYNNKEILIKIRNRREIVPLDDFYEGYYECDDGHVVKSMAEREIDNYLFAHNIKHGYEIPIKVTDESGRLVTLHPDFCIFDEKSNPIYYIEYWGYDDNNRDYTKTKKFKIPLYKKLGITLINITAKSDLRNLKANLAFKLNPQNIKFGEICFLE